MKSEDTDKLAEKYFLNPFAELVRGIILWGGYIGFYYILYLIIKAIFF